MNAGGASIWTVLWVWLGIMLNTGGSVFAPQ